MITFLEQLINAILNMSALLCIPILILSLVIGFWIKNKFAEIIQAHLENSLEQKHKDNR